jgi:hypothetical protein
VSSLNEISGQSKGLKIMFVGLVGYNFLKNVVHCFKLQLGKFKLRGSLVFLASSGRLGSTGLGTVSLAL